VTLEASTQQVWSWLIDRVAGRPAAGAAPALGDHTPGLPDTEDLVVVRVEPSRLLILGDASLLADGSELTASGASGSTTWTFVLSPIDADATRLIVRVRSSWEHGLGSALLEPLLAPLHDALERRQLDSLVREAETFDRSHAA
jgi:hypothetical protein